MRWLPRQPFLHERVLVARAAAPADRCEVAGEVGIEPRGDLAAEGFVGIAEAEIHARLCVPSGRAADNRDGSAAGAAAVCNRILTASPSGV